MKKSRLVIIVISTIFLTIMANAEEPANPGTPIAPVTTPGDMIPPRALGSNTFQIDLGFFAPLFSGNAELGVYTPGANLYQGISARLKWSTFLDSGLSLGIDLAGAFTWAPNTLINQQYFYIANVGPHITYFFRAGNFEFPLSLTPALCITAYGPNTYFGFSLRPGIGVYYDVTPNWSFGINVQYWWCPEIYAANTSLTNQNRYGNYLEINISALFTF